MKNGSDKKPSSIPERMTSAQFRQLMSSQKPVKKQSFFKNKDDVHKIPRTRKKGGRVAFSSVTENKSISFFVAGRPVTKHRARTMVDKNAIFKAYKNSRGQFEIFSGAINRIPYRSITPDITREYEEKIANAANAAMKKCNVTIFKQPVFLELHFIFEGEDDLWPVDVTDVDLDNAEKAVLDAMNGIVYHDDRLVIGKSSKKICGNQAGVDILVRTALDSDR